MVARPYFAPLHAGQSVLYVASSFFSAMESTIGAYPSSREKPDGRLCHLRSRKNSDGPTKEAVGAIRQHGSSGRSAGAGNHLARRVKPQHLKIASCKRAHTAVSLSRSLYIYRSIIAYTWVPLLFSTILTGLMLFRRKESASAAEPAAIIGRPYLCRPLRPDAQIKGPV
jgi:hypothetical protein